MFKDRQEELRRLEEALLAEEAEEQWEAEETEEAEEDWAEEDWEAEDIAEEWSAKKRRLPYVHAYNADRLDEDVEEFSRQIDTPAGKNRGRWIAAILLVLLAALLLTLAFLLALFQGGNYGA